MALHGFDGPCERERTGPPPPTARDYCAAAGHAYYADDGDMGRCYCGERIYPAGGPGESRCDA